MKNLKTYTPNWRFPHLICVEWAWNLIYANIFEEPYIFPKKKPSAFNTTQLNLAACGYFAKSNFKWVIVDTWHCLEIISQQTMRFVYFYIEPIEKWNHKNFVRERNISSVCSRTYFMMHWKKNSCWKIFRLKYYYWSERPINFLLLEGKKIDRFVHV